MPKPRFYNLPQEKQDRVMRSAINEFSRVPVNEFSINRIIQEANISRGSFYQYFEDKNDILHEIMISYKNTLISTAIEYLKNVSSDILDFFGYLTYKIIAFSESLKNKIFCENLIMTVSHNNFRDVPDKTQTLSMIEIVLPYINTAKLKYTNLEDIMIVIELLSSIMCKTVIKTVHNPTQKEVYLSDFKKQISMVEHGIYLQY